MSENECKEVLLLCFPKNPDFVKLPKKKRTNDFFFSALELLIGQRTKEMTAFSLSCHCEKYSPSCGNIQRYKEAVSSADLLKKLGCLHTKLDINVVPEVENKNLPVNNKNLKPTDTMSSVSMLSSSNATGSGRTKVALKPGHSLMDWIRLTHSGKDLTSTGGKVLEVTPRELAKHNSRNDAWIALRGKVYNITHYLDYHPGGEEELMRGAGKDATDLFNQVHQWVNAESMLQKCFVGILKKSWSLDAGSFPSVKALKRPRTSKIVAKSAIVVSESEKKNSSSTAGSEWHSLSLSSSVNGVTLSLNDVNDRMILGIQSLKIKPKELITDLTNENLFIKFNKDMKAWLNIKFPSIVKNNYQVKMDKTNTKSEKIELMFDGNKESCCSYAKADVMWTTCVRDVESTFWPCKLIEKNSLNYNTYLFTFLLPLNTRMWVPLGYHVFVKSEIEGMEIVRSYTPVVSSLDLNKPNRNSDGCYITLMIKIYPSGNLTPILSLCNIGENVFISSYAGTFSETTFEESDSVVMIAAGTGITPMIKVIYSAITATDKKRSLLLLFFNKTEEDILWKTEFENCSKHYENFQVIHILSEPNQKWSGYSGIISENILKELIPSESLNTQIKLICGPSQFTELSLRILEKLGHKKRNIFAFSG